MLPVNLLLSTVARSRFAAGSLMVGFVFLLYTVFGFAVQYPATRQVLGFLRYLTFYRYYNGIGVLLNGIDWGNFLLLSGIAAALVGLAVAAFQRRDLAV